MSIVSLTLAADLETPISAMIKLTNACPWSFLLESVEDGAVRGRYSVIGMKPDVIWRVRGGRAEVNRQPGRDPDAYETLDGDILASLRALIAETRCDLPPDLPPLTAGIFGYMGYDMVRLAEKLPGAGKDMLGTPDAIFIRPSLLAIFDSVKDHVHLVALVRPEKNTTAAAAYKETQEALASMRASLNRAFLVQPIETGQKIQRLHPVSNVEREDYFAMVTRARDYIWAGDIFQATMSQRFSVPFALPPFAFYRSLRQVNPSPYLFFFNFGDFSIIGSSPEILVRCQNGKVMLSPIAGTIKRPGAAAEDEAAGKSLLADPKERAEHLMLLDLGRNDVGRVCEIGSVEVVRQFALQNTSHLIHIVSDVEGRLAKDYDALDALMAGFPAGTVSGAPKVRAMEIIDELEQVKRGVYGGAAGYFAGNGDMDSCICLRTAVLKDGQLYVQAGGGIVADSVPEREYWESVNKARALIRAAEEAPYFLPPKLAG